MNQMQRYFGEGIDHLLDEGVLAVRERVSGVVGWALFLAFVLSCGHRRLKVLFQPEKMSDAEKVSPSLSSETFPFMTDAEIALAFSKLDEPVEFILSMRKADGLSGQRFEAIITKMEASEVAAREHAKAEIARKAQEDADRARKAAEEKAESDRQAAEAKRLVDEKAAQDNARRESKAQEEREAKFRQYVTGEFVGSKDIIQLATSKLGMIKDCRLANGITPDWQLAIIREVAWKCEGELRERPSFLPTDKIELDSYIASLVQEAKGLQSTTSKVITGAYERQIELACNVLDDINKGKVIHFPDGGRDGALDTASTEAAQKRAEREAKREERREHDRALRAAAKTPSQGGGKKH